MLEHQQKENIKMAYQENLIKVTIAHFRRSSCPTRICAQSLCTINYLDEDYYIPHAS